MNYGYARCITNETKQDINRQVRELKEAGAEEIFLEYEHGDSKIKDQQKAMFAQAQAVNMSPRLYTPGRARCTPSSPETEQRRRRGCTLTLPDLHGIIDVSKCWEE